MDLGDQRQHFVDVAQLVDLVERNDDRRVALEPAQDLVVLSPPASRLGDEHHHIGLLSHRLGRAVEDLVERVDALRLVARRIDEDELRVRPRQHALDAMARGLCPVGRDGQHLSQQLVEQRGLAGVRAPHQGHVTAAERRAVGNG